MSFHRTTLVVVSLAAALVSIHAYAVADTAPASRSYALSAPLSLTASEPSPAEMLLLGTMLDEGFGIPRNYEQAIKWYERAARAGQAEAMNRLGVMHANGHGVPRDYALALAWFGAAVKSGSISAINNIAMAYFHGLGVQQSYAASAKWLTLGVARGDARAQSRLAILYKEGLGVPRDPAIAIELLQRAAAQRYAPAMANLASMYAEGVGVERDEVRAYALLHAALQIGVPNDMRQASYDLLGRLAARLDEVQRPKADQLSREISAVTLQGRDPVLQR